VDVLFDGEMREYVHDRITTRNTHGTGCTLSAAIAANLAHGLSLSAAVPVALDFVHSAILHAPGLGAGHGPLNHFA
jgi:hydroxymethylpyrimidine/phosphomethylpyrimidine kinase